MPIRRCLWLAMSWVVSLSLVVAQEPDHRSHVQVPGSANGDAEKLFQKRFLLAQTLKDLREKHPELLNPEKLKKLAKQFEAQGINPNDPAIRKHLETMLRQQHPMRELSAEEREVLEHFIKEMFPPGSSPWGKLTNPETQPKKTNDPPEVKTQPGSNPSTTPEPVISPEEREKQAEAQAESTRQMLQLARNLERMAGDLNESPTLKQTLRDLSAMALRHAGEGAKGTSDLNANLARFNQMSQGGGWFQKNWPKLRNVDWPKLSAPRLPSVSMPWRPPSVPGGSFGVGGNPTGIWKAILTAVLVASLVLVLGKWLLRYAGRRKGSAGDDWQLGPWPVSPGAVHTREDLIRTFEYLSLLRFGRQARTWNHRTIARGLAAEQSPEHLAALHLADLYEQARYAPEESLPVEAIETYRRDLCLLAGVAAT